jgi:hypothetical protein
MRNYYRLLWCVLALALSFMGSQEVLGQAHFGQLHVFCADHCLRYDYVHRPRL